MRKGRRAAWTILALLLALFVGLGVAYRRELLATWHIHGLSAESRERRTASVHALGELGLAKAVPPLIDLLREELRGDHRASHWTSMAYLDALEEEGHVAPAILTALSRIGRPAVAHLVELQRDDRYAAIATVGLVRLGGVALPRVGFELESPNLETKIVYRVMSVITEMPGEEMSKVEALAPTLESGSAIVREMAIKFLGSLGTEGRAAIERVPETLDRLVSALEDPDHNIRKAAARALMRIGPDDPSIAPQLVRALDDSELQIEAAIVLAGLRSERRREGLTALLELALEGRADAAVVLERLGDGGDFATVDLEKLAKDLAGDPPVIAVLALAKIGGSGADVLLAELEAGRESVREAIVTAMRLNAGHPKIEALKGRSDFSRALAAKD